MALGSRGKSEHRDHHGDHPRDHHGEHDRDDTGSTSAGATGERGVVREERRVDRHAEARDRFGGINWGAAFFGWLVAVGMTAILAGIVGAVATAIGENTDYTLSDASNNAATASLVAAIVLAVVLALAYFAGGYVAGRMSRFDGAKQGAAAWVVGILITLIAAAVGWIAGEQYNVLQRVSIPNIPLSQSEMSTGGIITAFVVLALTLLAAIGGGAMGRRYHGKVDRVQGI